MDGVDSIAATNVVIGFGKAGRALAKSLSQHGQDTLIIEKYDYMYGGTCPNVGCAPSKTLIVGGNQNLSFDDAMARKYRTVEILHKAASGMALNEEHVTALTGTARFVADHELEVATPDGQAVSVTGERIFINTGATPVIPDIPGIHASHNVITSESAMTLDEQPQHLLIIGAGYIGLEFAGMFSRFGTHVTVLQHNDAFLPREDDDISAEILKDMRASGIEVTFNTSVTNIADTEDGSRVRITTQTSDGTQEILTADKVLVAMGRKPNVDDLNLAAVGIAQNEQGYIKVNDALETNVNNIWALGDVHGAGQHYYLSTDDFRIINNHLFGDGSRKLSDRPNIPYSIFVTPTFSRAGLNEKQAQAANIDYTLFKIPAAGIVKGRVYEDPRGLLKGLVTPDTGEILGVSLYHEDSHEVVGIISLAMKTGASYTLLRDQIFVHPTMGEALNDLFAAPAK